MSSKFDISFVREQFPSLSSDFAFLDNAGGSQISKQVLNRINQYLLNYNVQHGASYRLSQEAEKAVFSARADIASLVNARHSEEIVMGGSTTLLLQLLCRAIAVSIKPGDEIIVTNCDHEANIGPWETLVEAGAVIKRWTLNRESLTLEFEDLETLLTDRTRWVAMTHVSNVLGLVNPIAEVARRAHAAGARLCVDGVAFAPHRLVDVQAFEVDCYVFSFYKVFGPHYAMMWGDREFLRSLPSLNHYFIGKDVIPYKLQPGNVNFELSYGCAGVVDYLLEIDKSLMPAMRTDKRAAMENVFHEFEIHETALAAHLLDYLRSRKDIHVIGYEDGLHRSRVSTISFVVRDRFSNDIVRQIDSHSIGVRCGDFYSPRLVEWLGFHKQGGVIRVSIAHYNTIEEIDRLIACLEMLV